MDTAIRDGAAAGPDADGDALPVRVRGLTKRFGPRTALADIHLDVAWGSITCLAGPNGSGKSTLLKILAGLLRPTAGSAQVIGREPFADRERLAGEGVRFSFAPPALYDRLTARRQTLALARLSDPGVTARDVDGALERVGLGERARDRVGGFSFGMRQRLALAQALVPRPRLLVLDEPTEGLDPLAILELRDVLKELAAEGVTILLASHLLIELEQLGDHLLVLDGGTELYQGPPAELIGAGGSKVVGVDDPERGLAALRAAGHPVEWAEQEGESGGRELLVGTSGLTLDACRDQLAAAGLRLVSFADQTQTLERALLARLRAHRGGQA